MIKLIASDLDGTLLLNGAQNLTPRALDLIKRLLDNGVHFAAASGRQYNNLRKLFSPVSGRIAYIPENGSLCICNGEILSKSIIEPSLCMRIIDAVHDYPGCNCIVSGIETLYTDSRDPEFIYHLREVLQFDVTEVSDLNTDVPEPFLKIAVLDFSGTAKCKQYMKERFGSEIKIVTSGNLWVDFIAPGTNKGIALQGLMEHLQITPDECVAFGDQYNDVEMLQTAGTSYAMSTAAPGISYYSTYVTDRVEDVLEDILASVEIAIKDTGTQIEFTQI